MVFSLNLKSQTLKTYNGKFNNGVATYQYFENKDFERIFHGIFQYNGSTQIPDLPVGLIKGQYTNNKKSGRWVYRNDNIIIEGDYLDGELNGKWTKKESGILVSSAQFQNGLLIGSFNCNEKIGGHKLNVKGQFNEQGLFVGEWTIEYDDGYNRRFQDIQRYKDGVMFWRLEKNIETGEIKSKYDSTSFVNNYFFNLDNLKNRSIVNGITYSALPYSDSGVLSGTYKNFNKNSCAFDRDDYAMKYSIGNWLLFKETQPFIFTIGYNNISIFDLLSKFNSVKVIVEIEDPLQGNVQKGNVDQKEEIFTTVDEMPEFPGGVVALRQYLENAKRYPDIAKENRIQGKVYISFIIEKDGSVTKAKIVKDVDPSLDAEALRVISTLPKWSPGKQRGATVRVSYTVPISFKLE